MAAEAVAIIAAKAIAAQLVRKSAVEIGCMARLMVKKDAAYKPTLRQIRVKSQRGIGAPIPATTSRSGRNISGSCAPEIA